MAPVRSAVVFFFIGALLFVGGTFGASPAGSSDLESIAQDIRNIIDSVEGDIPEVAQAVQSITGALVPALEVAVFKQVTGILDEVEPIVDQVLNTVEGILLEATAPPTASSPRWSRRCRRFSVSCVPSSRLS